MTLTGRFPLIVEAVVGPVVCDSSWLEGERVVQNQISYQRMSPKEQREFNRWLKTNTILGSILAIGMLAMAVAGSDSAGRSDAAMAASPHLATTFQVSADDLVEADASAGHLRQH
jgi:hypothetical protein